MSLPDFPVDPVFLELVAKASSFVAFDWPDRLTTVGTGDTPLYERIVIARSAARCIYVHRWLRSDPDELHDHPWDWCSVILSGSYWEVTEEGRFFRDAGSVAIRKAEERHKVVLDDANPVKPVSLFITGIERREWGFHTPEGFVEGRIYRARGAGKS
jgi:hypothetical protein